MYCQSNSRYQIDAGLIRHHQAHIKSGSRHQLRIQPGLVLAHKPVRSTLTKAGYLRGHIQCLDIASIQVMWRDIFHSLHLPKYTQRSRALIRGFALAGTTPETDHQQKVAHLHTPVLGKKVTFFLGGLRIAHRPPPSGSIWPGADHWTCWPGRYAGF